MRTKHKRSRFSCQSQASAMLCVAWASHPRISITHRRALTCLLSEPSWQNGAARRKSLGDSWGPHGVRRPNAGSRRRSHLRDPLHPFLCMRSIFQCSTGCVMVRVFLLLLRRRRRSMISSLEKFKSPSCKAPLNFSSLLQIFLFSTWTFQPPHHGLCTLRGDGFRAEVWERVELSVPESERLRTECPFLWSVHCAGQRADLHHCGRHPGQCPRHPVRVQEQKTQECRWETKVIWDSG